VKFGVVIAPKIDDWEIFKYAEELGYETAWACDSQMLWSDCYATLALAAANTERIWLGPGVAAAGTRMAPVTAHSIASVSKLAPGRTTIAVGTGHTSMRVMGQKPMKQRDFEQYIRDLQALLAGEDVEVTVGGRTGYTHFLNREQEFIDLDHKIPIVVSANGPRALRFSGAAGDGMMTIAVTRPDDVHFTRDLVESGATEAGRTLPEAFTFTSMVNAVVLEPGESIQSDRVLAMADSWIGGAIHFAYELWLINEDEAAVPPPFRPFWEEYCAYVDSMQMPADRRYLQVHDGHATWLPQAERRFLTEEAILATTIVGTVEEIVDQIKAAEAAGVTELALQSPLATAREVMRQFAEEVRPCL